MKTIEDDLRDFVRAELEDGVSAEDLFEAVDLTVEDAFIAAFMTGKVDPEAIRMYLLDEIEEEKDED